MAGVYRMAWYLQLSLKNHCMEPTLQSRAASSLSSPVADYLKELYDHFVGLKDGQVATYIPELAKANPDWFGICLVTASGSVYDIGDFLQPFTIQSISKPFVYGLALEDNGRAAVLRKVGVEPTGDAFNSISLDPGTGRPRNPMINAGAIASAGLIAGKSDATKLRRLLDTFALYAGRELKLDETVHRSESETGHRNRAIGHMLRNFSILEADPIPVVELYFRQCSVAVTCRDLAMMAATLANRGVNPLTGKQALRGEYVESVLSVMGSCGMYDYAGEWIYNIGMPAKSGVAGGVVAVLPGQMGIGVFSPRLDARGNSVRGIAVCQALARHLDLHVFNRPSVGQTSVRLRFTGAQMSSSRVRTPEESRTLWEVGTRIRACQLQGNLTFASLEPVVRDAVETFEQYHYLVLDLKRVLTVNESACRMCYHLLCKLSEAGKFLVFAHAGHLPLLRRYMKAKLDKSFEERFRVFEDHDVALEWCENHLLCALVPGALEDRAVSPADYELFEGLTAEELTQVIPRLQRRLFQPGELVVQAGDKARELFFLARGKVSVNVTLKSGSKRRLGTFSAGMAFGEMALIDGAPRAASIVADTEVECDLLGLEDFEALGKSHPQIKIRLLENLSLGLCRKLRKNNRDLSAFD
jgi:glutaminase